MEKIVQNLNKLTLIEIVRRNNFRLASYGDSEDAVTHAICKCGHIVPKNADSHICIWTKLVPTKEKTND